MDKLGKWHTEILLWSSMVDYMVAERAQWTITAANEENTSINLTTHALQPLKTQPLTLKHCAQLFFSDDGEGMISLWLTKMRSGLDMRKDDWLELVNQSVAEKAISLLS